MGKTSLLPSWNLNCNCCNNEDKTFAKTWRSSWRASFRHCAGFKDDEIDEPGLVRPKRPSWIRRSLKIIKTCKTEQKEDSKVVKRSACLQSTQTDEEKIPDETIPDERYQ